MWVFQRVNQDTSYTLIYVRALDLFFEIHLLIFFFNNEFITNIIYNWYFGFCFKQKKYYTNADFYRNNAISYNISSVG